MASRTYCQVALGLTLLCAVAHALQCASNASDLAFRMLQSNIKRGQGKGGSGTLLSQIELGIFQQALRESIHSARDSSRGRESEWRDYLRSSVSSMRAGLSAVNTDTGIPLDRLSVGTSMIYQDRALRDHAFGPDISALRESVRLQRRNANGGLWYFDDRQDPTAYRNLSYLDGMYSYPAFALLATDRPARGDGDFGLAAASEQLRILHDICRTGDGLLVHGYDASRAHAWADPRTGASPVVWGRSLSWYTLGLLNGLEIARHLGSTREYAGLRRIFFELSLAQVEAAERGRDLTGGYGVWQVVDRPGAVFSGHANYVEASAGCMTVFTLLRGVRCGLIEDEGVRRRAVSSAAGIYRDVLERFLIRNGDGTLGLNGTSDIASLHGNVSYEYYVTRPVLLDSLIGTSAFILASLEMGRLCH